MLAEESVVKNSETAKRKSLCVINNLLFLVASFFVMVALFFGVPASNGTITVSNFYRYVIAPFTKEWSNVYVGLNLLADSSVAIAYIAIIIRYVILVIKASDGFFKICKNGYSLPVENGIKSAVVKGLTSYVDLTVCCSLVTKFSVDMKVGVMLLASIAILIISDYIKSLYITKYIANRTQSVKLVVYNIIKKIAITVIYAMLYMYVVKLASVTSIVGGIDLLSSMPSGMSNMFTYVVALVIIPIVDIVTTFRFISAFGKSADDFFDENDNFAGLAISTGISCGLYIFVKMILNPSASDNFFEYAISVASMQLYPVMLSVAGILMGAAYKCACADERLKENEVKSKALVVQDNRNKADEERKEAEIAAVKEVARREEVTKQIAEAIIRAQKEEKANQDAEDMSQIINAALQKLYVDRGVSGCVGDNEKQISDEKKD